MFRCVLFSFFYLFHSEPVPFVPPVRTDDFRDHSVLSDCELLISLVTHSTI